MPPKHDVSIFGYYIKEMGNDIHLFSKYNQCDGAHQGEAYRDTLSVDGKLYDQVFFAKIIPNKLHKDFKNLGMKPCSSRQIYSRADSVRKKMPGFGERRFLMVENVTGVL